MSKRSAPRPRTCPRLEILEDRLALATRVWDGGAVSNNWTAANNWQGNVAPVPGDDLVFPASASDKVADNNFPADTIFQSITLGGGYTLRGARVQIGTGGITDNSNTSNVISFKLFLSTGTRTISVGSNSTLFLNDEISGAGGIIKTGGGNLSLRNNNDYTGLTDIQAGILFIEKDNALGAFGSSANGTRIRPFATLLVNDQALGAIRTDEHFTVDGQGAIRGVNDVELRGPITTLGQMQFRHDGGALERLLVSGKISGPGGVIVGIGGGQVWLNGTTSNTYQGLTNVLGHLRLDNSAGDAIPTDLFINSVATVRHQRSHQLADDIMVTIQQGGSLLTDQQDETFHRLVLNGGTISGQRIQLLEMVPVGTYIDALGRLVSAIPYVNNYVRDRESDITIDELVATSGSTKSALIFDVEMVLTTVDGTIRVNNGPADIDLQVNGTLYSLGTAANTATVLTLEGQGKTLVQDFAADEYFVREGQLQFGNFLRNLVPAFFDLSDVTVFPGAKFIGDVAIKDLQVFPGGRVKPGPLDRFNLVSAIVTQLLTGTLSIRGNLDLEPGAILEVQLNNATAGLGHEQLNVLGSVSLNGAIIEPTVGPSVFAGQNYRVINNSGTDQILGFIAIPAATSPFLVAAPTGQRLAVNHSGGLSNNDLVLTLQNTAPMAPGIAINQSVINEGGTVTVTGRLVDPDAKDTLRLLVNWGDGTSQVYHPGRKDFAYSHRYRDSGQYTARFEWLDQNNVGNSREFDVTVENVPPVLSIQNVWQSRNRLRLRGQVSDVALDAVTLTADFGDGSGVRTVKQDKWGRFDLGYRYRDRGTFTMVLTATDKDGGTTTLERIIRV
jgi:autotransporter-associated beta strand protein